MEARAYYDEFADWYERERRRPYHTLVDDLEVAVVERLGAGRDIAEVGCGTGLLLQRFARFARSAVGVDLSERMLDVARGRGLTVMAGDAAALPLADASVDVACAFKVLPHVPSVTVALSEMARVTRPGGWVVAEFYGAHSLRRLVKRISRPQRVSPALREDAIETSWHSLAQARRLLPPTLRFASARGIRVVTPFAASLEVPLLGAVLRAQERAVADLPGLRALGGFLVVVAQRLSDPSGMPIE